MANCIDAHKTLNELGIGKCSVPMWCGGVPAGFCDDNAYGEPDPERRHIYSGYVPFLACPGHGGPTVRVFLDGNQYCAVRPDFVNLQESPAGFGTTKEQAKVALEIETQKTQEKRV